MIEAPLTTHDPAQVFAALGDTTRLRLVNRLAHGRSRSISELTTGLDLSRQGVTKHLRVLEQAGIVRSGRQGRENRFRFEPGSVEAANTSLDAIVAQWDEALLRLKSFVEDG